MALRTRDKLLRHPSFQGLREDPPVTIVRNNVPKAQVAGIGISHPERIVYPDAEITKLDLAEYYLEVSDWIMPYLKNRPLSTMRCPEGISEECFFQRHIMQKSIAHLYDTDIPVKGRDENYIMIKDKKGLITLVQLGVIEFHPWGCLAENSGKPDWMIFDLDPDPGLPWKYVVDAAREIRLRMQEFGLESFLKTTGGKGLHVTIPLTPHHSWDTIKAFARAVADSMAHDNPKRYTATASKAQRKGKIFVDYLRNNLTASAVAPYVARAREGATVATPLDWKELTASLKPSKFTVKNILRRLQKKSDPWEEFFKIRQQISDGYLKALKIWAY